MLLAIPSLHRRCLTPKPRGVARSARRISPVRQQCWPWRLHQRDQLIACIWYQSTVDNTPRRKAS